MWTKAFWKAALERAIRTAAQSMLAAGGVSAVGDVTSLELLQINYVGLGLTALAGAMASILFSIVGSAVGSNEGPSFGAEQIAAKPKYQPEHAVDIDDGDLDDDHPTWSRDA